VACVFNVSNVFFQNPKKHDILRFLVVPHVFSNTSFGRLRKSRGAAAANARGQLPESIVIPPPQSQTRQPSVDSRLRPWSGAAA